MSQGRYLISKIIEPYKNIAIRCHTDGILLSDEPVGIKYGFGIGDLVDEGMYPSIKINSSGKINYYN
jgi:hypothetical protein